MSTPQPQCVEIFHSRRKDITGRDLKFAGYIQPYKILTENTLASFEKKDCHLGRFFISYEAVCRYFPQPPLEQKVSRGRILEFAGYVHHYKSLSRSIFGLIL